MCYLQETHFKLKGSYRLKIRKWKKTFHANGNDQKMRVIMCISDKTYFKTETIKTDKMDII